MRPARDVVDRVGHVARVNTDPRDRAGQQDCSVVPAGAPVLVEEDLLIGEDVALLPEDVVELPQLVVEEARRPGDRENPARLKVIDVTHRPVELALPLLLAERGLGRGGQLVDHRRHSG